MVTEKSSNSYFNRFEEGSPEEIFLRELHDRAIMHISDTLLQGWINDPLNPLSETSKKIYRRTFDIIFFNPLKVQSNITQSNPRIVELTRSSEKSNVSILVQGYGGQKDPWIQFNPINITIDINPEKIPHGISSLKRFEILAMQFPFTISDFQKYIEDFDMEPETRPEILYANFLDAIDKLDSIGTSRDSNSEGANEYDSMITNVIEPKGRFL